MIKTILREVVLVIIVIALQVAANMINGRETVWLTTIALGVLLGVVDYVISFFKGELESINYKINLPWKKRSK